MHADHWIAALVCEILAFFGAIGIDHAYKSTALTLCVFLLIPVSILLYIMDPLGALRNAIRTARIARGICPVCKYDLRATPDKCPECGAVPKQKN
jgi:hypothetical protein